MALSTFLLDDRIERRLVKQTTAGTTADNDVVGKAPTIYSIRYHNPHASTACYIKLYDAKTATNTDNPVMNLKSLPSTQVVLEFPDGITFTTGLCIWAAQQADDSVASTAPAGNTKVEILTN